MGIRGWYSGAKTWGKTMWGSLPKDKFLSSRMASGYLRYAGIGAGMGAIRGASDNIVGQDRVSILGGAMQGALYGAAFRGYRHGRKAYKHFRNMRPTARP